MSEPNPPQPQEQVIDLRKLAPQQSSRHVLQAYTALEVGASLVLLAEQEPSGLRSDLERELAGAFTWEMLASDDELFRVRITKRATTALPRLVADTTELLATTNPEAAGSIWKLAPGTRDLDSNIIALPADGEIAQHIGPDRDVLILVLEGTGQLHTEQDSIALSPGNLLWLPAQSQRRFTAGADGLRYLTVHQRKPTLNITAAPDR